MKICTSGEISVLLIKLNAYSVEDEELCDAACDEDDDVVLPAEALSGNEDG